MSLRHRRLIVPIALFAITVGFAFSPPVPTFAEGEATASSSGSVGLRDLTVLALQNDPGLVALRHNIPIEEARKRAAVQWRDPELRLGYSRDDNIQLDQPYTRSGTATETFSNRGNEQETGGANGNASGNEITNGTPHDYFYGAGNPGCQLRSDHPKRNGAPPEPNELTLKR